MDEQAITCCFTGHRPQSLPWGANENDPRCLELKLELAARLEGVYEAGWRHFLCGMAIGCDTYFADEVLALREKHGDITLEAAIPCSDQASRWNSKQKTKYAELISACDSVKVFQEQYSTGCMLRRNEYMVDCSSTLIACFDGRPGGTMNTIVYAKREGLAVRMLDVSELQAETTI